MNKQYNFISNVLLFGLIFFLPLSAIDYNSVLAVPNVEKNSIAYKIQNNWLHKKGLLKPYFFINKFGKILKSFPLYKIKRTSSTLIDLAQRNNFKDINSLNITEELSQPSISYLINYIENHNTDHYNTAIQEIQDSDSYLELLLFAHKWGFDHLKKSLLPHLAEIAVKHNLLNNPEIFPDNKTHTFKELIEKLGLNPDETRKALVSNPRYYSDFLQKLNTNVFRYLDPKIKVEFSPNNTYLAVCTGFKVQIYNLKTNETNSLPLNDSKIINMKFSKDSKYIVLCLQNQKVIFYDIEQKTYHPPMVYNQPIYYLAFSNNNTYLALSGLQTVKLYNLQTNMSYTIRQNALPNNNITDIAFSPDSKYLAVGYKESVSLYVTDTGTIKKTLTGSSKVLKIQFSNNSRYLVVSYLDGEIKVYNIYTGQIVMPIQKNFSGFGTALGSGSNDLVISSGNQLMLYKLNTGILYTKERVFNLGNCVISKRAFSSNGRYLAVSLFNTATNGISSCICMYDIQRHTTKQIMHFVEDRIKDMQFSNSKYLAVWSYAGDAKLYNMETKTVKDIFNFRDPNDYANGVHNIKWSTSDTSLVLLLKDGTIQLRGNTHTLTFCELCSLIYRIEQNIKDNCL